MRINTFKTLNSGRVLIETKSKDEMEALEKDIQAKCGDELEINVHTLRQHRLTYVFKKKIIYSMLHYILQYYMLCDNNVIYMRYLYFTHIVRLYRGFPIMLESLGLFRFINTIKCSDVLQFLNE